MSTTLDKNDMPVFPNPYTLPENRGLTLRDYFAAVALKGPIADLNGTAEERVQLAYEYADAMLKERSK
jgi:hypothetical protein